MSVMYHIFLVFNHGHVYCNRGPLQGWELRMGVEGLTSMAVRALAWASCKYFCVFVCVYIRVCVCVCIMSS